MKDLLSRRNIVIGAGGAVVVAGIAVGASRLFGTHHAPTPYDDLLTRLADRDGAAAVGKAVLLESDSFDPATAAEMLRAKLGRATLTEIAGEDAAAERLMEAHGWVLPQAVAELCELAAKAA